MSKQVPQRIRADQLLVERGLAGSRTQAQALILAGQVRRGPDDVIAKAGQLVASDTPLTVAQPQRFVSRGGEKLEGFLETFAVNVTGAHALDIGASTGGFTDCLLQRGAAEVTCVDVGHAQLHGKLRGDARVTNMEKINARNLDGVKLPHEQYEVVVMDVSFISLTKVLPSAWARVRPGGILIALVKPQFEATKAEASIGRGIIRDTLIHQRVLNNIKTFCATELPGANMFGEMESPLKGGDGNAEFLIGLGKT
ncbi:MAG TPA: TlyA family RNA methyltransferase [Opitutales bacterium]|jgi:23S rRNA (cytidine1920-2'-O)/16S rRNA (cytidine1409-2'-O)-methyltransferase|nr:TlyA family RNA methyltransferase [Opitutales bacterium]